MEIKELGLFINKEILVISDLHIGREEALNKKGILIPLNQFSTLKKQVKELMKLKPKITIINGDLKHEFGTISEQEWRDTLNILDLISRYTEKIILIKGNHDTILGPIAKKRNIEVLEKFEYKDMAFIHGNKLIPTQAKTIIIGHVHPSLVLREGTRKEHFKCFMKGKYKNQNLIVMPSLSILSSGMDILTQEFKSPYIKEINNFELFAIADKIYNFGKVKNIKT
jgi:hypothetical protein